MANTKMLALLAFIGSVAQATPVAKVSGFSSICSDISLDYLHYLHATCPDDSGLSVTSEVYLPGWIGNSDQGQLAWTTEGDFMSYDCSDWALLDGGSTLTANCPQTNFTTEQTYIHNSTLNLEEHIANYNGHLLSDLNGAPDITNLSNIPIPADIRLGITFVYSGTGSTDCAAKGFGFDVYWPERCWAYYGQASFNAIQITTNPGWSIEGYTTSDCSGTPGYTASPNDTQCVVFNNGSLKFFKFTPLWNCD